jgi:hypothetical protein
VIETAIHGAVKESFCLAAGIKTEGLAILESVVVAKNSGRAFVVRNGQRLRAAGTPMVEFFTLLLARE